MPRVAVSRAASSSVGLAGPRLGPRRTDDDLQAAGALVDGKDGRRRRVELQVGQESIAEPQLVLAQPGRLGLLVEKGSGPELHLRERRRLDVDVAAAETGTCHDTTEGFAQLAVALGSGIAPPPLQRGGHLTQAEQAGRVLAGAGSLMRR